MEAKVNPWCKLIQKHTIKNTIYFKIMEKELLEHLSDISKKEMVNHEAIKVIDAWDLGFCLGNTVKYISRAGKKDSNAELQDLKKALWYLQHHIETLEKK